MDESLLKELPLRPQGERTVGADSHDVTGGNNDGFESAYSCLYRDGEDMVLFEHEGAGCLREIRTIGFNGNLRIFLDGKAAPWADIPFERLYAGKDPRFPPELVCDELRGHGSAWCYASVPFRKSCRVTATDRPESYHFYNIFAHAAAEPREETQPEEPDASKTVRIGGDCGLAPFEDRTLLCRRRPGVVRELTLRIPEAVREYALEHIRLRMRWEKEDREEELHDTPDVEAPLGLFFASGLSGGPPDPRAGHTFAHIGDGLMKVPAGRIETRAMPVFEQSGVFTCRFPMPFRRSARISLINTRGLPVEGLGYGIEVTENRYPEGSGYFHALYRREDGTIPYRDYTVLDVRGCGKYVGCAMRLSSRGFSGNRTVRPRIFLEGDARFYADDARAFLCAGTGTEEYFNWGWYDGEGKDGVFCFPTHGYPEHVRPFEDRSVMYRFHITDYVPFYRAFRFDLEHGPEGQSVADYESVAFFYRCGEAALKLTDIFDSADGESCAAHGDRYETELWRGAKTMVFEGNGQVLAKLRAEAGEPVVGQREPGRTLAGCRSFNAGLCPENRGVRLRRLYDGGYPAQTDLSEGAGGRVVPAQRAEVYADGEPAGIWHLPARRARDCWMEDEFDLPRRLTAGKSGVRLELRILSDCGWNEYRYEVYCYV